MTSPGGGGASSSSSQTPSFKIVLLGPSSAGKSCLAHRYRYGSFQSQHPTVGVAFADQLVTCDSKTFRLNLWDTAGSERFMSITPLYFRDVRVALLCYDLSLDSTQEDSMAKLKYWRDQLYDHVPSCCLFLAGTKADLVDQSDPNSGPVMMSAKAVEFAEKVGIGAERRFVTSAKSGVGVDELFAAVAKWCSAQIDAEKNREEAGQRGNQSPRGGAARLDLGDGLKPKKKCCK